MTHYLRIKMNTINTLLFSFCIFFLFVMYLIFILYLSEKKINAEDYYILNLKNLYEVKDISEQIKKINFKINNSNSSISPRILANSLAMDMNLSVTRIQPVGDDATVSFWFNNIETSQLFSWLIRLSTEHNINVVSANIQQSINSDNLQSQIILVKNN